MKVTIIHKEGCPLCERAIREFAMDGHEIELFENIQDAPVERRRVMMANMLLYGADKDAFPQIFINDAYIDWKLKTKMVVDPVGNEIHFNRLVSGVDFVD